MLEISLTYQEILTNTPLLQFSSIWEQNPYINNRFELYIRNIGDMFFSLTFSIEVRRLFYESRQHYCSNTIYVCEIILKSYLQLKTEIFFPFHFGNPTRHKA